MGLTIVIVGGDVGGLLDTWLGSLGGSSSIAGHGVGNAVLVVVLSPLVVVSADLACVLLIIVGLSGDGVVRLAPSGVGVLTVSLLGVLVVVVSTLLLGRGSGGTGINHTVASGLAVASGGGGAVRGTLAVATVSTVATTVATNATVANGGLLGGGGLALSVSTVGITVGIGGSLAHGGGTVHVAVLTPLLGTPLVVILVVPFVIGLGIVGLGPGHLVRLVNLEVLISAISIPVGAGFAPVARSTGSGGGISLGSLAVAVTGTVLPVGGGLAVHVLVARVISVVVLSPLVVIGLEPSGVLLVVVRLGGDGVVGLSVSGVEVGTGSLLGPLVVVVSSLLSTGVLGGTSPDGRSLTVSSLGGLGLL